MRATAYTTSDNTAEPMPRRAVAATAATVVATSVGFLLGAWSVRAPMRGPAKTTTSMAAAVARARAPSGYPWTTVTHVAKYRPWMPRAKTVLARS